MAEKSKSIMRLNSLDLAKSFFAIISREHQSGALMWTIGLFMVGNLDILMNNLYVVLVISMWDAGSS